MTIIRWACALALAFMPSFALAETQTGRSIVSNMGWVPSTAIYCDDGAGKTALCSFAAPATTTAQGSDGTTARTLRTDNRGGLVPAQGVAASARATLVASTATSISAATANRIGLSVQLETALAANLFLCTTQTTSCSATAYDAMIPSGVGAGTTYTFLFAPSTALYAFSTGTPTLVANSWTAP
jgi:hypothetical protein